MENALVQLRTYLAISRTLNHKNFQGFYFGTSFVNIRPLSRHILRQLAPQMSLEKESVLKQILQSKKILSIIN